MTTVEVKPTPVTHRTKPWLGTGLAFRAIGETAVEVKWPGISITRRESVGSLAAGRFPQSWPLPAEHRTRG